MRTNFPELHRQVVFGEAGGKIIWQPRILAWYTDKIFSGEPFPPPFTGMDQYEIYRELDCSARLYEYNDCFVRVEHPSVRFDRRQINETDVETTIHTPVGKQVKIERTMTTNWHKLDVKREVETEEELKVATWREENGTWRWDEETYRALQAQVGDLGAPTMFMPRMNVQGLYLDKMGVEKGVYAIIDWQDTVEAFFRAREENHERLIDIINAVTGRHHQLWRERPCPHVAAGLVCEVSPAGLPATLRTAACRGQIRLLPLGRRHGAAPEICQGDGPGRH